MTDHSPLHPLDAQLAKFDAFFDKATTPDSVKTASPHGLIYAFFPTRNLETTARFDASAFRTCLIAKYLQRLLSFGGKKFLKVASSHDGLFAAVKAELDWTFPDDWDSEIVPMASDHYRQLLTVSNLEKPSLEPSIEAMEAARIASMFSAGHCSNDQECDRLNSTFLIVLIPEDCLQSWNGTRPLLGHLLQSDGRKVRISAVTVGRVTFTNGWASTFLDYITRRRSLIDSSYRHKLSASGAHESNAPLSTRRSLTLASICFELMAHPARRAVIVEEMAHRGGADVDPEAILPQWARNGVFVVYNYARLSGILEKYSQGSSEGRYPALAPLDRIDGGIKTKIAMEMGDLIGRMVRVQDMNVGLDLDGSGDQEPKLPHIRNDMFQFSSLFSNYYSKRRVLTDAVSFAGSTADALVAKIHVLSRLKKLYVLWFQLLSLKPVEVM